MESEFLCCVHRKSFHSICHLPIVLTSCVCLHCSTFIESQITDKGSFTCFQCGQTSSQLNINEVATNRAISQLQRFEIRCDSHPSTSSPVFADTFCRLTHKAYCSVCSHSAPCCDPPPHGLHFEVLYHLTEEAKRDALPDDLRTKLSSSGKLQSAQAQYDLLQACVSYNPSRQQSMPCSAHPHRVADYIRINDLKLECQACLRDVPNIALAAANRLDDLKSAVRDYLRKVHCYSVPQSVLHVLRTTVEGSWEQWIQAAAAIGRIQQRYSSPIPALLYCPGCEKAAARLQRMPCETADHGLCEECISKSEQGVVCPLDLQTFLRAGQGYIDCSPPPKRAPTESDRRGQDDTNEAEFGRYVSQGKQYPHWRGTKIPYPALTGPDFQPVSRFFAVFPPRNVPMHDIHTSMQGWCVNFDEDQVETVDLEVTEPVVLTGITVSGPVDRGESVYVSEVYVTSAAVRELEARQNLISTPVIIYGGTIAKDIAFQIPRPVEPQKTYTIQVRLRTASQHPVLVFKGNQYTAKDRLVTTPLLYWSFLPAVQPETVAGGDNSRSGPILRLFYK